MGGFFSRWLGLVLSPPPGAAVLHSLPERSPILPVWTVGGELGVSLLPATAIAVLLSPHTLCAGALGVRMGLSWGHYGTSHNPNACFCVCLAEVCLSLGALAQPSPAHRDPVPLLRIGWRQRVAAGVTSGCCKCTSASANTK